jgi:putative flippase GtrA
MNARAFTTRLRRPETRRFFAFLLTGAAAAVVNISSRMVFGLVMPYEAAVLAAFLVGMTTAFLLAKMFVFASSGRGLHVEYGRFALVNLAALVQVLGVSLLLARVVFPNIGFVWHGDTIAHILGVLSPVLISYKGHKRFSFA